MIAEVDPEAGNNPQKSRAAQVAPARTLTHLQALATLFAMAVLLSWGFGVGGADASGSSWTVRAGNPPVQAASPPLFLRLTAMALRCGRARRLCRERLRRLVGLARGRDAQVAIVHGCQELQP